MTDVEPFVLVRPIEDDDMGVLYDFAFEQGTLWHRVAGQVLPRPGDFATVLEMRLTMQYVIEIDDEFAGCCALFDHDQRAETMWLEVVATRAHQSTATRMGAGTLLVRAFRDWQIRKVYTTVHSCEPVPFDGLPVTWEEEGRLHDFHRHDGRLCDAVILSVQRDGFTDRSEEPWLSA